MEGRSFYEEAYSIVEEIPEGKVLTYGEIARLAGKPQCSRMVGQALGRVPQGRNLPCHRVVNSQGRLVPGWADQRAMLEKEGVSFKPNGCIDMAQHLWKVEELLA